MKLFVGVLHLLLLSLLFASGQSIGQVKTPIYVDATIQENDSVGQLIVFNLKEAIRGSNGFRLIEDSKNWPYLKIAIVSLRESNGASTALGYTWLYDGLDMPLNGAFVTSGVQTCGRDVAASCAKTLFAKVEGVLQELPIGMRSKLK
jgi:hypothetical protein